LGKEIKVKEGLVKLTKRNFSSFYGKYFAYLFFIRRNNIKHLDNTSINLMIDRMKHIYVKHGINYFILYLKTALWTLNCYLGNNPVTSTRITGTRLKLAKGLPYIIPVNFRREIRRGNIKYIHIIASILNSYKGLEGIYDIPDLSTIYSPLVNIDTSKFEEFILAIKEKDRFPEIHKMKSTTDPIVLSAGPNSSISSLGTFKDASACFHEGLFPLFEEYAKLTGHTKFIENAIRNDYHPFINGHFAPKEADTVCTGKLSLKFEAAGKVRVFAIVDYFTQWLFKPLHECIFSWLRSTHSDATFDQNNVLENFVKNNLNSKFWSFDLKSATDLIPNSLYRCALKLFLPDPAVDLWMKILDRPFKVPADLNYKYGGYVRYNRGQPMGMLSSWASLALVHHMLVRFAYFRVSGDLHIPPNLYLVLGDDIVISDKELACSYKEVCREMEIPLSLYKSYEDSNILNFASQTFNNKGENLSPISLKEVVRLDRLSRKLEFSHRLIRLGYINAGLPSQFKVFFSPIAWLQESKYLSRGTLTTYGKRVYRSLLQPSGRNNYHINNYLSAYKARLSFGEISDRIDNINFLISGFIHRYDKYPRASFWVHRLYLESMDMIKSYRERLSRIEEMLLAARQDIERIRIIYTSSHEMYDVRKLMLPELEEEFTFKYIPFVLDRIKNDRETLKDSIVNAGYSSELKDENDGPIFSPLKYVTDVLKIASSLTLPFCPFSLEQFVEQARLEQDSRRRITDYQSRYEVRMYKLLSNFYPNFRLKLRRNVSVINSPKKRSVGR
jgi:hypothetical protein